MKFGLGSLARAALVLLAATNYAEAQNASTTNTSSIAYWQNPRAAIVQNTLVIEGGLRANGTWSNGKWLSTTLQSSPFGRLYYMSLCSSFNTSSDPIDNIPYAVNESQSPATQSWVGGALFATEYEWYTYGGLPQSRRKSTDLNVLQANMYLPSSAFQSNWVAGVNGNYPPENSANVSNTVAYGAWTNAPSESLGFWFGGLQSTSGGYVDMIVAPNKSDSANTTSQSFVKVDMTSPTKALWSNVSFPNWITPRSEGSLVWLPYSSKGILLAIGGVDLPGDQQTSGIYLNTSYAASETNNYMTNIAVYDIGSDTWALQSTLESGGANPSPPQTAQFCHVTASASDNTSYFIYVYGGYDGTFHQAAAYDSIWVLSVPAFQWTLLGNGNPSTHRRMRHQCVLPNPTQMLSIGGSTDQTALMLPDWLDVYDLNADSWTHHYDASSSDKYQVHPKILSQLNQGSKTGGFTVPSTLNSSVSAWLNTPYKKLIQGYSPYNWCAPNSTVTPNGTTPTTGGANNSSSASQTGSSNKTPAWQTPVIAVLATVAGLAILGALIFFCCLRKRKDDKGNKRRSVFSWMEKSDPRQPPSDPDSEHTAVDHQHGGYIHSKQGDNGAYEMPESNVASPHGHGTPRLVSSPSFGGEMESSTRHEIMTNPPRDSMSIGQHPYYPRSIQGDFINRSVAGSESISSPSMGPIPSTLAANVHSRPGGQMSPFELAHDRSHENLSSPDENTLDVSSEGGNSSIFGIQQQMHSPLPMTPAVARKPMPRISSTGSDGRPITPPSGELRPQHHRHQSSLSSDVPTLPSPTPAEDQRRSRMINDLPDIKGSPVNAPQQPTKKPSGPLKSIYQEKFDEE